MMENIQNSGSMVQGPQLPPDFQFKIQDVKMIEKNGSEGSMDMNMSDGGVKERPVVEEIQNVEE